MTILADGLIQKDMTTHETKANAHKISSIEGLEARLDGIVGGATPSDTQPANPKQGEGWFNTSDGKTYIWYEDVDSGQWVEQSPDKIVQDPSFGGVPLMSVMWFSSRSSIGLGFVAADGQILSDHLYPDASKEVVAGKVPTVSEATWESTPAQRGKYVKTADGFRVPDLNGIRSGSLGAVFLRGDGSRSAGTNGLIQEDQMQNITGSLRATPTYGLISPSSATGAFYAGETLTGNLAGQTGGADNDSANRRVANFDASRVARTGTETRPLNVTGVWAIKVFGAVVNQGEMDAAELSASLEEAKLEIAALNDKIAVLEKPYGWRLVREGGTPWNLNGVIDLGIDMRNRIIMFQVAHNGTSSTGNAHTDDGSSRMWWDYGSWEYGIQLEGTTGLRMTAVQPSGASPIYAIWIWDRLD